jgi:hypothetical protein
MYVFNTCPSPTPSVTRTPSVTPSISVSQVPSSTPSITVSRSISRTPSRTPSTTPAPCYVYEYINTTGSTISLNGTICPSSGGGSYNIEVPGFGEGTTSCLVQFSQATIDAYAAIGLTLTQAAETCT